MIYPKQLFERQEHEMAECLIQLEEGNFEAIKFYHYAKQYMKSLDEAIRQVQEQAIDEANGGATIDGYDISVTNGRKIYDFNHIPAWHNLKNQLKDVEEKAKHASSISATVVHTDTGELIEPAKVIFTSDYLTIKKKR